MRIQSVTRLTLAVLLLLMTATAGANQTNQPAPTIVIEETAFSFEPVVDGTVVSHDFVVRNDGDEVLHINKVKTG